MSVSFLNLSFEEAFLALDYFDDQVVTLPSLLLIRDSFIRDLICVFEVKQVHEVAYVRRLSECRLVRVNGLSSS